MRVITVSNIKTSSGRTQTKFGTLKPVTPISNVTDGFARGAILHDRYFGCSKGAKSKMLRSCPGSNRGRGKFQYEIKIPSANHYTTQP